MLVNKAKVLMVMVTIMLIGTEEKYCRNTSIRQYSKILK